MHCWEVDVSTVTCELSFTSLINNFNLTETAFWDTAGVLGISNKLILQLWYTNWCTCCTAMKLPISKGFTFHWRTDLVNWRLMTSSLCMICKSSLIRRSSEMLCCHIKISRKSTAHFSCAIAVAKLLSAAVLSTSTSDRRAGSFSSDMAPGEEDANDGITPESIER